MTLVASPPHLSKTVKGKPNTSYTVTQHCPPCRFFYASSACIYPEGRQLETEIEGGGLKEEHAWPAQVMS